MTTPVEIGCQVRVPWGQGTPKGMVVDAYDSGPGRQVVVAATPMGSTETLTVTVPLELVQPA